MAFWPFSRRKKSADDHQQQQLLPRRAATSAVDQPMSEKSSVVTPLAPPMTPKSRQAGPRSTTSATSARDSPRSVKKSSTEPTISTAAKRKTLIKKHSRPGDGEASRQPLSELRNQQRDTDASRSSFSKDAEFSVVPTLKPSTQDGRSLRSKKSIRSKGDNERIKSLRAGSSPVTIPRPLSEASGDIMVRETRRAPSGIGRPSSQISLPLAESLRDEYVPDLPENASYKINAFDVFAPHPTIKYTANDRATFAKKDKEPAIPEAEGDFGPKARINELADDLDAAGLRQLMDRDRRRRERKRKLNAEKLARELEAQDEKEKEKRPKSKKGKGKENERSKSKPRSGPPTNDKMMSGARSRSPTPEALPTMAGPLEGNPFYTREEIEATPVSPVHRKFRESRYSPVSPVDDPFGEPQSAISEKEEPIVETIETAKAVRLSQASISPPPSPVLDKRPPRESERYETSTPDIPEEPHGPSSNATSPEPPRRDSEASSNRAGSGWANFFRRTKTKTRAGSERGFSTPSESGFSNVSRESFQARTGQSSGPTAAGLAASSHRSFRRSGTPQRTQSKFREELPDVPKVPDVPAIPASVPTGVVPLSPTRSPPMSRGASPDLSGPPSPFVDRAEMLSTDAAVNVPMEQVHPALRGDIALSRHQSMRSSNGYNGQGRESAGPSAALLSQSLASVDSEGSWLSGRPSKRSSSIVTARDARTGSKTSLALDSSEQDSRGSPLMFGRRISNPGQRPGTGSISTQLRQLRQPSVPGSGSGTPPEGSKPPTPIPFGSDLATTEGDRSAPASGEALLHTAGIARTPTLVNRDRAATTRSREGLLDIFDPRPKSSSAAIELAEAEDQEKDTGSDKLQPPPRNPARQASVAGRQPSVLSIPHQEESFPHNRESHQNTSTTAESPGDELEQAQFAQAEVAEMTEIKRATSVSLRNRTHARQMSAGSAKLLDLAPRNSGETSRRERRADNRGSIVGSLLGADTPTTPRIPEAWRDTPDTEVQGAEEKPRRDENLLSEGGNLFK